MRPRRRLSALAISALLAFSALPLFAGPVAATTVGTEAAFRTAWATDADTLITLTADITFLCEDEDTALRISDAPIVVDGGATTNYALNYNAPCTADALEQDGIGLVTLRNLTLTGNPDSGDGLNTAGAAVVEGSTVTDHGDDAVDTDGDATVTNSSLLDNGDNGLEHDDLGDATVSGSTLSGNDGRGIQSDGLVTLTGSTVNENGEDGIQADGNVTLSGSTISGNGGDSGCPGNGIDAGGAVSVTASSSVSNNADAGIFADGTITVTNSDVSGNGAGNECGRDGIHSDSGDAFVTNSTVSDNREAGVWTDGDATVTDSTVSGNHDGIRAFNDAVVSRSTVSGNGGQGGSGVVADNDATVTDSTITANADSGVDSIFGDATVTNSTVTDNVGLGVHALAEVFATNATITGNGVNVSVVNLTTIHLFGTVLLDAADVNCFGVVVDAGFNFVDDASCGSILPNAADPQLGTLASNGGPTQTRLPADTSPLLDVIPGAQCRVTTDQRGIARPQGGGCDIGAVEVVPPAASITDVTVTEGNSGTVDAVFTVTLSRPSTGTVSFAYATANGTATVVADYQAAAGTLTFAPGDVSETITVKVVGDAIDEPNETFVVNLTAPVGATLADAQGTGTILDDDAPAAGVLPDAALGESHGSAASSGWPPALGLLLALAAVSFRRSRSRAAIRGR